MKWRLLLGIGGILGLAAASFRGLPEQVRFAQGLGPGYVDEVTLYEGRFAAVRGRVPLDTVVGYRAQTQRVGEQEVLAYTIDGRTYGMDAVKAYFLAQYALAPAIVDRHRQEPPLVENRRQEVRFRGEP